MYALQSRWKLEANKLYYYGLRNRRVMFRNTVKLSKKQREIVAALPKELTEREKTALGGLLGTQVVPQSQGRNIPKSCRRRASARPAAPTTSSFPGWNLMTRGAVPCVRRRRRQRA